MEILEPVIGRSMREGVSFLTTSHPSEPDENRDVITVGFGGLQSRKSVPCGEACTRKINAVYIC